MKYWIIPCNVKEYDVVGAFNKLNRVDWKQSNNLKSAMKGDVVLIYLSAPFSYIKYVCRINKVNKPKVTIDDREFIVHGENFVDYGNHMELELVKELENEELSLEKLRENGMKGGIQGPRSIKDDLLDYALNVIQLDQENELENHIYKEGKIIEVYGTKYERNYKLRKTAIEFHGKDCKVCGFNFGNTYGEIGEGFIEIHHINPMFTIKKEVIVNPETDLIPVCSNCHRMIHRRMKEPLSIDYMKSILN